MKRARILSVVGVVVLISSSALAQDFLWIDQFGTLWGDFASSAAAHAEGNVYIVGSTHGPLAPDVTTFPRCQDGFLQKRNPAGEVIWTKQFGGDSLEIARAVAVDSSGNIYVAGEMVPQPFVGSPCLGWFDGVVRKFDSDGNQLWSDFISGSATSPFPSDGAKSITVDSEGNIWVGGWTTSALPGQTSSGSQDAWVRKYDPDGNLIVTVQFGTTSYEAAWSLAVDSFDNLYAAGSTGGTFPGQVSTSGEDVFVQSFDRDGVPISTWQYGSNGHDKGQSITVDPHDNVWIAGYTTGDLFGSSATSLNSDVFLARLDSAGNPVFSSHLGGPSFDFAPSPAAISSDPDGNIWLVGHTQGQVRPDQPVFGSDDVFVAMFNQDAQLLKLRQFGTDMIDRPGGVAVSLLNHVYLVGQTSGGLSGDPRSRANDAFVLRIETVIAEKQIEEIEDLIEILIDLDFNGRGGLAQLEAALRALNEDPPDIDETIDTLGAFINFVQAQNGKKIPADVADELIEEAQAIIDSLIG